VRRLLIRPGAIGDLIVSFPALEHLRAEYTEVWVARNDMVGLVRFADQVGSIPGKGLNLLELGQAPERLWEELKSFDEIVSWYGNGRQEFRQAVSHLPVRFFRALPDDPQVHATDYYLRQVGAPLGAVPRIECPRVQGDFAVIQPFSSKRKKNWPLEKFRELARALEDRGLPVRWCAGPEEEFEGAERYEDLYELGRWLAAARLFIGNDSGVTHLAAAVGTPVVALFGPSDPAVWGPRGAHVRVVRHQPLAALAVEAVLRAAEA